MASILDKLLAELPPATPEFSSELMDKRSLQHGISTDRGRELAEQVRLEGPKTFVVESIRAENELKDVFRQYYDAEVIRLSKCPRRVQRDGDWRVCGEPLTNIQHAIVHHSFHLMFEASDDKTQRQVNNDISEKLFPTDIKGVKAALSADDRADLLKNPIVRDRLLRRGNDDDE